MKLWQRCAFLPLIEDGLEIGSLSLKAATGRSYRSWCCISSSRRCNFCQEPRASRERWKHRGYLRSVEIQLTAWSCFLVFVSGRKHVLARFYDWSRSGSLPLYHKRRFGPRWRPKSRSELIITNTFSNDEKTITDSCSKIHKKVRVVT